MPAMSYSMLEYSQRLLYSSLAVPTATAAMIPTLISSVALDTVTTMAADPSKWIVLFVDTSGPILQGPAAKECSGSSNSIQVIICFIVGVAYRLQYIDRHI